MFRSFGHNATRIFAILAVCLQAFMPSVVAVAQSNGLDVSLYFCAPSIQPETAEAKQALAEISEFLGKETPKNVPSDGHCPFCTLIHGVFLPQSTQVAISFRYAVAPLYRLYQAGFVYEPQGPPTGQRAPPKLT